MNSRGKIIEKEYGKSKVYFADQSQFPTVAESELKAMDEEITTLDGEVKSLQSEIAILRNGTNKGLDWEVELKELDSSLSDEELEKEIKRMEESTQKMEERVASLQG